MTHLTLGIETSCDETAAAVVADGRDVRSSVVSSQVDLHARFGGVVPEVASRAHVELIDDVVSEALVEGGATYDTVDLVAACHGPGLAGALLVGVSAAKAVALAAGIPYVGVNHLEAHLHATVLEHPEVEFPAVVLIASGGHTLLVEVRSRLEHVVLGETVDDAAGEAFDKVARFLGLGYPGGPAIDRISADGDAGAVAFPRPMLDDGDTFSFSGLKTAVVNRVTEEPGLATADVAASFQAAVVDVLATKLDRAAGRVGAATVALGGGVAANRALRSRVAADAEAAGRAAALPGPGFCTDNGAMIAAAGYVRFGADGPTALDAGVVPGLRLG
ncbi:MAG: tRNA (adenosine(37)-N6)-threonylcarbamoyltransferase complex transferase subunit TsaD [Acidimicrobiia bacterium]